MLLVGAGTIGWNRSSMDRIRTELADLGLTMTSGADGLALEDNSQVGRDTLVRAAPILAKLNNRVRSLSLHEYSSLFI
jgi:hypothetical protein